MRLLSSLVGFIVGQGGFLALGCILAGFQYYTKKLEIKKKDKEAAK